MFDDGTLHGRVPDFDFRPRPSACKPFYKAKAANAIDAFETAFDAAGQRDGRGAVAPECIQLTPRVCLTEYAGFYQNSKGQNVDKPHQ